MVSSGILEYRNPGEVINNYTTGSSIEMNLSIHKSDITTKMSQYLEEKIHNVINTSYES